MATIYGPAAPCMNFVKPSSLPSSYFGQKQLPRFELDDAGEVGQVQKEPRRNVSGTCAVLGPELERQEPTIGALQIRIGFWGPLYYNYNKDPPKVVYLLQMDSRAAVGASLK